MNPQSRPTSTREPASLRRSAGAPVADDRPPTNDMRHPPAQEVKKSGRVAFSSDDEASADLPTLAHILARYREHGTLARSVAVWDPARSMSLPGAVSARSEPTNTLQGSILSAGRQAAAPVVHPRPFAEVIEGLQTRELDGNDLFEQFFGPTPPAPPASR